MEDSIQTIIIQITTITILLIGLLLVVITFIASVKRQIQEKALFDLELVFLQKKIDQQILEINTCSNNYDNTWSGYRKFTIQKKEFEKNSGVCSFYLVPHDGKAIPGFSPGQHLFININIPGHDKDFLRCYSISSSPSIKEYYRISFNKALPPIDMPTAPAGIVSSFFYDTLKQDDIIDVRAPSGKFFLDILSHKPVVLVAGGIGIAPLLSMLDAISDSTAQRETWFFLSVTNKQNHFMQAHVAKVADEHEHIHLYICYSHPQPEDIQGHDYDHAGRVNLALLKKYLPSNNFEFYLCGSAAMIDSLKIDLAIWGVAKNSIYYEQFSQPKKQKIKEALNADKLKATVLFSKSNKSLEWCEGGDSILDLALATGVYINCSCKRGMCGQCQTTIKSGEVFYNEDPEFLPNLEKGMCLPCVARTKQRLELYA